MFVWVLSLIQLSRWSLGYIFAFYFFSCRAWGMAWGFLSGYKYPCFLGKVSTPVLTSARTAVRTSVPTLSWNYSYALLELPPFAPGLLSSCLPKVKCFSGAVCRRQLVSSGHRQGAYGQLAPLPFRLLNPNKLTFSQEYSDGC